MQGRLSCIVSQFKRENSGNSGKNNAFVGCSVQVYGFDHELHVANVYAHQNVSWHLEPHHVVAYEDAAMAAGGFMIGLCKFR